MLGELGDCASPTLPWGLHRLRVCCVDKRFTLQAGLGWELCSQGMPGMGSERRAGIQLDEGQ